MKNKAFTIIELLVVVAVIAVLSTIVLFSARQYANMAKDSSIAGNLAVLIPAGETYYNINDNSYGTESDEDLFCDLAVVTNAESQMPTNSSGSCSDDNDAGVCCVVAGNGQSWAACAKLFATPEEAYCVDSTGIKRKILNEECTNETTACP